MTSDIYYKAVEGSKDIAVFLRFNSRLARGRRVGTIRALAQNRFAYYPDGGEGGDAYDTVALVKRSIEGEAR